MRRTSHSFLTLALLLVFGFRALIPAGYMPAADGFGLQLCPQGLPQASIARLAALQSGAEPAQTQAHHHGHHDHHDHGQPPAHDGPAPDPHDGHGRAFGERCSFAGAALPGPVAAQVLVADAAPLAQVPLPAVPPAPQAAHRHPPQQPRAPPFAS